MHLCTNGYHQLFLLIMKKHIFSITLVVLGFIIGVSTLSVFADWTAPQHAPPICPSGKPGCDAPLNVGPNSQDKKGPIRINTAIPGSTYGLDVFGIARFWNGFVIENRMSDPTTNLDTGRMWLITP